MHEIGLEHSSLWQEVASLVQQGIRSHFQLLKLAETDLKHPPFLLVAFFFTEIRVGSMGVKE